MFRFILQVGLADTKQTSASIINVLPVQVLYARKVRCVDAPTICPHCISEPMKFRYGDGSLSFHDDYNSKTLRKQSDTQHICFFGLILVQMKDLPFRVMIATSNSVSHLRLTHHPPNTTELYREVVSC